MKNGVAYYYHTRTKRPKRPPYFWFKYIPLHLECHLIQSRPVLRRTNLEPPLALDLVLLSSNVRDQAWHVAVLSELERSLWIELLERRNTRNVWFNCAEASYTVAWNPLRDPGPAVYNWLSAFRFQVIPAVWRMTTCFRWLYVRIPQIVVKVFVKFVKFSFVQINANLLTWPD